jgi:aspartate/methionine/tyrosine aminotransferase
MKEKRDYILKELEKMPGVNISMPPNGAFYVLPDVSGYFGGDDELCLELSKSKKLALVPGSSFGAPGTVQLSYATKYGRIGDRHEEAERILGGTSNLVVNKLKCCCMFEFHDIVILIKPNKH